MSLSNLTISNTLPVGQSFLWHRRTVGEEAVEEFSRAVDNPPRVVCLRQTPTDLYYTAIHPTVDATEEDFRLGWTRRWLEDYFHLDKHPDLPALYANWRQSDPGLFGRVEIDQRAVGVRLLRQDPWECLLRWVILSGQRSSLKFHHIDEQSYSKNLVLNAQAGYSFLPCATDIGRYALSPTSWS